MGQITTHTANNINLIVGAIKYTAFAINIKSSELINKTQYLLHCKEMQKPYANTKEKRVTVVIIQLAFNTITIGDHLTHIVLDSHVVWPIVSEKIRLLHSYETCIKILFSRRYSIVYYVIFTWQPLQEPIQQCHMNDIITARERSTREGTVFTFLCQFTGGTPAHWSLVLSWGGVPCSRSFPRGGGNPVKSLDLGTPLPQPGPGQGYPLPPRQDQDTGAGQGMGVRYAFCVFTQEDCLVYFAFAWSCNT